MLGVGVGVGKVIGDTPRNAAPAKTTRGRREAEKSKRTHLLIGACHPCAGAMLIFSVSFQF